MHHHSFDSIIYFIVLVLLSLNLLYYGLFNSCFSPFFFESISWSYFFSNQLAHLSCYLDTWSVLCSF